jgi:hypothetical protein
MELNHKRIESDTDGRRRAAWFNGIFHGVRSDQGITVMQFHYNQADLIAMSHIAEQDMLESLCRESDAARRGYRLAKTGYTRTPW